MGKLITFGFINSGSMGDNHNLPEQEDGVEWKGWIGKQRIEEPFRVLKVNFLKKRDFSYFGKDWNWNLFLRLFLKPRI